jgi:hypothetical protein
MGLGDDDNERCLGRRIHLLGVGRSRSRPAPSCYPARTQPNCILLLGDFSHPPFPMNQANQLLFVTQQCKLVVAFARVAEGDKYIDSGSL